MKALLGERLRESIAVRLNELDFSATFEKLEHNHKFVVDRVSAETMFADWSIAVPR